MWFDPTPDLASYGTKYIKQGYPSVELQYVDIPNDQLSKYLASNNSALKNFEYEPTNYLIPRDIPRQSMPLQFGRNIFANSRILAEAIKNLKIGGKLIPKGSYISK